MKTQLTALDIHYLLKEIRPKVEGALIRKVYQVDEDKILIQLYKSGEGTEELLIGGNFVALLNYKIPRPERPSNFAMLLRKYMRNKRVVEFSQLGFDRIIMLKTEDHTIIAELLPKPNVYFVDNEKNIIWSCLIKKNLQFRELRIHKGYVPPSPPVDPRRVDAEQLLQEMRKEAEKKVVVFLAQRVWLSGVYAEETCLIAGVDKNKKCGEVTREDASQLLKAARSLLEREPAPAIILTPDGRGFDDVVPFMLEVYRGRKSKPYESFNDAINDYFVEMLKKEEVEEAKRDGKSRYTIVERLEHRLEMQMQALEKYKEMEEKLRKAGEKIYEHYDKFETFLNKARDLSFHELLHLPYVKRANEKEKEVVVEVDGIEIKLRVDRDIHDNAAMQFEEAKRMRKKVETLLKQIEETKRKLEEARKKEEEMEKEVEKKVIVRKEKKKKKWYEKFRWFITSSGLLGVCGRDATTNEILIKKYAEKDDWVFHADYKGAPFGLLKGGIEKAELSDLREMAQFVASFSRAWKEGITALQVFFVRPEQVSKKTPAGEYMGKGAFMIYGERNWLKTEISLAVALFNNEVVVWPVESVKARTGKYVIIKPGTTKPKELASSLLRILQKMASEEERELLESLKPDDVVQKLPPGGGEIIGRKV